MFICLSNKGKVFYAIDHFGSLAVVTVNQCYMLVQLQIYITRLGLFISVNKNFTGRCNSFIFKELPVKLFEKVMTFDLIDVLNAQTLG